MSLIDYDDMVICKDRAAVLTQIDNAVHLDDASKAIWTEVRDNL